MAARRSDRTTEKSSRGSRRVVRCAATCTRSRGDGAGRCSEARGNHLRNDDRRSDARPGTHVRRCVQGRAGAFEETTRPDEKTGATLMAQMNMVQAINSAMDIMLTRDPAVIIM